MSEFQVVRYSPEYRSRWDRFIASLNGIYKGSKNTSFLFFRDFLEYHGDRFEDYSLLVFDKKKLLAVLPANKAGDCLYSHQGLTYGGLVLDAEVRMETVIYIFSGILDFLAQGEIKTLEIKMLPSFYKDLPGDELDYLLFLTEAELIKSEIASVIDYRKRIPLHDSRKGGLKTAEKNNLVVREVEDFESFWTEALIPNLMQRYKTSPVHSLSEIKHLANRFPRNIRQFNVLDREENLLGGATIFETNTVAHVQYLSANEKGQELGSLDLLFSHLIENILKNKRYFDFGTSNIQEGKKINSGLLFWKESFGARTRVQRTYRVTVSNRVKLKDVLL